MTTGQLSAQGAGMCAASEALYLYAYPDPGTNGEPFTIGIGHTRAAGLPTVRLGDRITMARAWEIYAADMGRVERDVRAAVKPQQNQAQFDALCSFHLNTGALRSGSVDDKLNRGDVAGALATWGQYINAAGKPLAGLRTRRREEIALYRTGVYPSRKILVRETPTSTPRTMNTAAIPWRQASPVVVASSPADVPATAPIAAPVVVLDMDRPLPPAPVKPRQAVTWWSAAWREITRWFA